MLALEKHSKSMSELKRPLRMLDIGGYEGEITAWFLNNLATNPESHVYVIDTWKESSKVGIDYKKIRRTFQQTIKKTGKETQCEVLPVTREDGLYHLLDMLEEESIDVAFVDASQDPQEFMTDAILIWKLMRKGGIVIFDDYTFAKNDVSRSLIDTFIRNYQSESIILETNLQIVIKKRNIDELSLNDYKSMYYRLKRITSLSDLVTQESDRTIETNKRHTIRKPRTLISKRLSFTTIPSFTKTDQLDAICRDFLPGKERIFLEPIIAPATPSTTDKKFSEISTYKGDHPFVNLPINIRIIISLFTEDADKKEMLLHSIEKKSNSEIIHHDLITKLYKLKRFDNIYIKKATNLNTYSDVKHLNIETINSITSLKFSSLKPNTYDIIRFALIADGTFTYEELGALHFKGRDSASVKWNSLYVLAGTYCLKKGGTLSIVFYGGLTRIVCEFISFVSNLFSGTPTHNLTKLSIRFNFRGFKGITEAEQNTLLNWFHSCTPGLFYKSLGVACKPAIQQQLQNITKTYEKSKNNLYKIIKEYKQILDNCSPSEKQYILQYIISLRINNYLKLLDTYIK